MFKILTKKM